MSAKFVNEYVEEMCDLCYEHKYGVFVNKQNSQICEECVRGLMKELTIFELENS